MAKPIVDFPVFDADNHMYEKTDAFTKFLPPEYSGLIKYVEVNGRTKIAVRNVISDYIPNPTFNVVGRPGRVRGALQARQPRGEVPPGADGRARSARPRPSSRRSPASPSWTSSASTGR